MAASAEGGDAEGREFAMEGAGLRRGVLREGPGWLWRQPGEAAGRAEHEPQAQRGKDQYHDGNEAKPGELREVSAGGLGGDGAWVRNGRDGSRIEKRDGPRYFRAGRGGRDGGGMGWRPVIAGEAGFESLAEFHGGAKGDSRIERPFYDIVTGLGQRGNGDIARDRLGAKATGHPRRKGAAEKLVNDGGKRLDVMPPGSAGGVSRGIEGADNGLAPGPGIGGCKNHG